MRYSFVFAHGTMVINGERRDADGGLLHLDLPWRPGLAASVSGEEGAGGQVSVQVLDLLGSWRQAQPSEFVRAGSRARLIGTALTHLDDATSHRAVGRFSACRGDTTWQDLKRQGQWLRARAEQALAGDPLTLTLDELLDLAEIVSCPPSELTDEEAA